MRYIELKLYEDLNKNDVKNMFWYHGTKHDFITFDPDKADEGYSLKGPGFYLTSNKNEAEGYGNILMTFKVKPKKILTRRSRLSRDNIIDLIKSAPNLEETLANWDENPSIAFHEAIKSVFSYISNPLEMFETIWYDFYKNNHMELLKNMTNLGYSGSLHEMNNSYFFVCFDPNCLELINKEFRT